MITLSIDTSSNTEIMVGLTIGDKEDIRKQKIDNRKSQAVLVLIQELLDKHKVTLKEINTIKVHEGPGSFTGLRVGISVANTLGYYLGIPVNGRKIGYLVEPRYT